MTFYSIDVDELQSSLQVNFSLNQKKNTLTVKFRTQPINGSLKICSQLNEVVYENPLTDQINKISIYNFNKGVYTMEIAANNNKTLREFEIK